MTTRYYRKRVLTLIVVLFFSYVVVYKFTAYNKKEDTDPTNKSLRAEEIQELYRKDDDSITEIETTMHEKENVSEEQTFKYQDIEATDASLSAEEIQKLYTKEDSMTAIETQVQKERNMTEEQLIGVTKRRLADVILIGMFKGGTGTITVWLSHYHPQVVHLHMNEYYANNYIVGPEQHMATIPNVSDDKIIYERCTVCYTRQESRERILAAYPQKNVKLLVMVRDPLERLISIYVQTIQMKEQKNETFEEYVFHANGTLRTEENYFQHCFYVKYFAKWLMLFPRENIHLVDADMFIKKPWIELEKIEKFLKIEQFFTEKRFQPNPDKPKFHCLLLEYRKTGLHCMGHTKGRFHPTISDETLQRLRKHLKPYNEQFFTLTGQRFSWYEHYD
ncbi:unnamed protein product [Owenia fusiformis]|uniref:Uncharacterized protein n=1 Tax=Owenia fusiformis TaxID=6347 RepID=A0A8J1Y0X9_OWEFU|nr:unnamed protein product [Owenia fusiformis]